MNYKEAVTIGPDGLLRIWGVAVNYNKPFVLLHGLVCWVTSDSIMGQVKQ